MTRFRSLTLALFGALIAAPAGSAQTEPVTVFVVRHAEKGPETPDPDLTPTGQARAKTLVHMLGDAGVGTIIASEFKRTQQTAAPLAAFLGLKTRVVGAGHTDSLIAALRGLAPGSRALVVSHSNLVPGIVEQLSGVKPTELTDADYDRLYVVTFGEGQRPSAVYLHFGAPSAGKGGVMRP